MNFTVLFSMVGGISVGVMMIVLARLSQRLGNVTYARAHHIWLYVSAVLMWLGVFVQAIALVRGMEGGLELQQDILWVLLIKGLPAIGITIALIVAWYYWSWLLAERD